MTRPDKEAIAIDNSLLDLTHGNRLRPVAFSNCVFASGPAFSLPYMCLLTLFVIILIVSSIEKKAIKKLKRTKAN